MERKVTLGEVGSPDAPPGSRPWAVYVRDEMVSRLIDATQDAWLLEINRNAMVRHEGWRVLTDRAGNTFRSYEAFCVAPQPFGLGYPPTVIDRIIEERKAKSTPERAETTKPSRTPGRPEKSEQPSNVDNINITKGGTDPDYLTARIARDRPDILDRMKAGEYPSVRAAALDAGILKPSGTVPLHDPRATARALARRFGPDDLRTIAEELLTLVAATPPALP